MKRNSDRKRLPKTFRPLRATGVIAHSSRVSRQRAAAGRQAPPPRSLAHRAPQRPRRRRRQNSLQRATRSAGPQMRRSNHSRNGSKNSKVSRTHQSPRACRPYCARRLRRSVHRSPSFSRYPSRQVKARRSPNGSQRRANRSPIKVILRMRSPMKKEQREKLHSRTLRKQRHSRTVWRRAMASRSVERKKNDALPRATISTSGSRSTSQRPAALLRRRGAGPLSPLSSDWPAEPTNHRR